VEGDPDGGSLERLFDERGKHLLRATVALAGSRADGEDLLQAALERLLRNRRRVETDRDRYRTAAEAAATGGQRWTVCPNYGSDDQTMQPGVRAVPATCP
jgi:hypothetical protein